MGEVLCGGCLQHKVGAVTRQTKVPHYHCYLHGWTDRDECCDYAEIPFAAGRAWEDEETGERVSIMAVSFNERRGRFVTFAVNSGQHGRWLARRVSPEKLRARVGACLLREAAE